VTFASYTISTVKSNTNVCSRALGKLLWWYAGRVRLILGQWFENSAAGGAARHPLTAAGSQHSLSGVDTRKPSRSRQPGAGRNIIAECSPPMKCSSSSPSSSAPAMPQPRPPTTRSRPATSSSFAPVLIRTGKPLSCWFAGFVRTVLSAARSCARIVAAMLWPGTRTARRQSPKSGVPHSPNPRCASAHGGTTGRVYIILSANRLDARREVLGKKLNRQDVGFTSYSLSEPRIHGSKNCWLPGFSRPDNEHYAAPCRSP